MNVQLKGDLGGRKIASKFKKPIFAKWGESDRLSLLPLFVNVLTNKLIKDEEKRLHESI